MAKKIWNFLDNPWIAFPGMILLLILFMVVGLKFGALHGK
jgi:hypothetical protein